MEPAIIDIAKNLSSSSLVIILGNAGSGKTTLLTKWVLSLFETPDKILEDRTMPFYIPLVRLQDLLIRLTRGSSSDKTISELAESDHLTDYSIEDCLELVIEEYGVIRHTKGVLEHWLEQGLCVIFLDGLDEVAPDFMKNWLKVQIRQFLKSRPGNRIVLSSRLSTFIDSLLLLKHPYNALEVANLNPQDIELFVKSWFVDEIDKGNELLSILEKNERLQEIAANPLLLSIIAVTHERDWYSLSNSRSRSQLYEYCMEILLYRWDEERQVQRSLYDYALKRSILERFALELHLRNEQLFSYDSMRSSIEKINESPNIKLKKHQVDSMVRDLLTHSAMFQQLTSA